MGNWPLEDWNDYWKLFEQLCWTLIKNEKEEIVSKLKDAQKYVNGMSDGWCEFLIHFQTIIRNNQNMLNQEEIELSDFLLSTLKKALNLQ